MNLAPASSSSSMMDALASAAAAAADPAASPLPRDVMQNLTEANVAIAASLLLLNVILSLVFQLGLESSILISALRCYVQLTLMGRVLEPVFQHGEDPVVVFSMTAALVVLGSGEAFSKTKYSFPHMHWIVLFSMLVAGSVTMGVGMTLAIGAKPWYTAQVFVPTCGMILGNSISGIALGIRSCLVAFKEHAEFTEVRLAYGASRWEAALPVVRESLKTALLPPLNSMAVMGLISIPGQMTGQILAGAPIAAAVHFQQIVMYMIVSSTAIGTLLSIVLTTMTVIDPRLRLRTDLVSQDPFWLTAAVSQTLGDARAAVARWTACCWRRRRRRQVEPEVEEDDDEDMRIESAERAERTPLIRGARRK
ncbi:hypothetical protein H9P43_005406 [Blastocladiella emersonii ATCC 22665]|nr:hypothetical protein H9P43_005406 [Blastocladiella emersonii ATCC 22665]